MNPIPKSDDVILALIRSGEVGNTLSGLMHGAEIKIRVNLELMVVDFLNENYTWVPSYQTTMWFLANTDPNEVAGNIRTKWERTIAMLN